MTTFHFLRPWWLLALIPFCLLLVLLWRQKPFVKAWEAVCDGYLLPFLMERKNHPNRIAPYFILFFSGIFMIIGASGPTWSRYPVPSYKPAHPILAVLDLSERMNRRDITPSRLKRAKFKLRDLLKMQDVGPFGLVVYSSEPFVVSPLTEDGQTIVSLLPDLTPELLPVQGHKLERALKKAAELINNAGFQQGDILVLSAEPPSASAISEARQLARTHIYTSVLPILKDASNARFAQFAQSGGGRLLSMTASSTDIERWVQDIRAHSNLKALENNDVPIWRDEGRWFLIPALIMLLVFFRRGWLQRIHV